MTTIQATNGYSYSGTQPLKTPLAPESIDVLRLALLADSSQVAQIAFRMRQYVW